ncbi:sorbin and SH3 domain-containing protein 2 isoform X4 [Silurus meridionalis]|nr:sorbin and SH3 domain-containing protein 2 isoform X4 [Silurus meridionalis]XP_046704855.1 sorbin and SH3 domain-containing protein 2 isoform X4 [Silurus meridionalis]XP_046704856.1 sorbin and SH3 domain-containing protein 2 isoform X4 [Silurus meridionalis]XP_046704857.1 sorbin and SH3 domain-containing protein 2 isoform X4 [Silurus meridionalis]
MNTDSGGQAPKSTRLSLTLTPMKRVQSSPNLYGLTGTESPVTDTEMWWPYTTGDTLRNGNLATSSLAAKGFRSVRPNLQDKKSPTPGLAPHRENSQLHPADCNTGTFSLNNYPTQCHDGPLLITHNSFSREVMSASSEQSSRGNRFSDFNTTDSKQPLSFSSFPSVCGPEKPRILPSPLDHLNSHSPVRQNKRHVASLSICITPRHQTEASYTQTLSLNSHTPPKRKDPLDSRTVFHPSLPPAVQQVAYPGPPVASWSSTNRPHFSTDYISSSTSDSYLHPLSHGLTYSNLDPYPPLSGSSSRAQSLSSMAMLEELRTCGIDSEGGSETPSPTHYQMSSSTDNMALNILTTSTANGQMTVNGSVGVTTGLKSHLQRPFSPSMYPPLPSFSSSLTSMQQGRSTPSESVSPVYSAVGSVTSMHAPDDEKRGTAEKAPHYSGIGPIDEFGIPTATRTTVDRPKDWYKTMFKQIHVVQKPEFEYSGSCTTAQTATNDEKHSTTFNVHAHPAPKSSTYRPITKSISDNGTCGFRTSSSSSLPTSSSAQPMSHNHNIHQSGSSTPDMNQWGPPDRKVDTRKYRAEPRSIFDYEPGKSSILDQEKAKSNLTPEELALENEPWYKFFAELEFGKPPPKKHLDYDPESALRIRNETFLYQPSADRSFDRPSSSASDNRTRRKSEPTAPQPQPQTSLSSAQSIGKPSQIHAAHLPEPTRTSNTQKRPLNTPSTSSLSRSKGWDISTQHSAHLNGQNPCHDTSFEVLASYGNNDQNKGYFIQNSNSDTSHVATVATFLNDDQNGDTIIPSPSENLKNGWQSDQESLELSPKPRSWSCDDLLSESQDKEMRKWPEGIISVMQKAEQNGFFHSDNKNSEECSERSRHTSAHTAPGFLKMYKKMHHINRQELSNTHVCSVKARIHNYESEQDKAHCLGNNGSSNEIPHDMVHNRISEFESLIQKSKSMPNLKSDCQNTGMPRIITNQNRSYSIESLLDEEPPIRKPPERQPQYHKILANVPIHIQVANNRIKCPTVQQDFSDSDHDAFVSDVGDFIQIERSSNCSESDFDHCSFTSSDSFCGSSHHHRYNRQLISSCKGMCPATLTRFTTMIKHERAKIDRKHQLHVNESDIGLSKLAFLVSPVPFCRKKNSHIPKAKKCMYRALDSALKDIYEHICTEKQRGSLPENSILHRLLTELIPEIPERKSSIQALEQSSPDQLSSFHDLPDDMYIEDQSDYSYLACSASCNHIDNNQKNHNTSRCCQDKDTSRGYSYPDIGRQTPQSRRPTPEVREKLPARAIYDFKALTAKELSFNKGDIVYITRQIDNNWYEGEHHGKVGIFPISYVEKISPSDRRQPVRPPPPTETAEIGEAVARYNFSADTNVELSLKKGERVIVLCQIDQNWYSGKIPGTNKQGIFPVSYVDIIQKSTIKSPSQPSGVAHSSFSDRMHGRPSSARLTACSPTSTPRQQTSPSPFLSSQRAAHLQAVTGEWLALTLGLSPSGTPAPTPPPLPSNFHLDFERQDSPAASALGPFPLLKEGHFVPISSPKSYMSPEPSPSPQAYLTSASITPSPISPTFDSSPKFGSVIELNTSPNPGLLGKKLDFSDNCDFEKLDSHRSGCPIDLVVYEPDEQPSSSKFPLSFRETEEDICEELVSIIQASQAKCAVVERAEFDREDHTASEDLPKLFIEEDPSEYSKAFTDHQSSNTFTPVRPVCSEMSEHEQAKVAQSPPMCPSSNISSKPLSSTSPTSPMFSSSTPRSTPPLPGLSQSPTPSSRQLRSPKVKPVLRHDVVVIGKPPRSPVMSRRSCGSPVRGQNYPSHRCPAQDSMEGGGEPFQALYTYMPRNEDELELKEGDIVDVMEKCDDGWFVGTSRRSKFFGTFPGNYVKRL